MKKFRVEYKLINGLVVLDQRNAFKICQQIKNLNNKLTYETNNRKRKNVARKIYLRLCFCSSSTYVQKSHPEYFGRISLIEYVWDIIKKPKSKS